MDRLQVALDGRVSVDGDADLHAVPDEPDGDAGIVGTLHAERHVAADDELVELLARVRRETPQAVLHIAERASERGLERALLARLRPRELRRPGQRVGVDHSSPLRLEKRLRRVLLLAAPWRLV